MSREFYSPVDGLRITQFYGGERRGVCILVKLTDKDGEYLVLQEHEARALGEALLQWADDELPEVE